MERIIEAKAVTFFEVHLFNEIIFFRETAPYEVSNNEQEDILILTFSNMMRCQTNPSCSDLIRAKIS